MIPENNNNNDESENRRSTGRSIGRNSKKTIVIAAGVSLALVIAITAFAQHYYNPSSNPASVNASNNNQLQQDTVIRHPPPRELTLWGKEATSFEQAKTITGINATTTSLPSYLPSGLGIASTRTNSGLSGNYLSVFYTPAGVTATDKDTFEKVMDSGGLLIVYSKENVGPTFNQTKMIKNIVNEAPTVRHLSTINGHAAILVDGNTAKGFESEVTIFYDQIGHIKTMTNLVSMKYTAAELKKIAESIKA